MMRSAVILACVAALPALGDGLSAGRNVIDIRGRGQEVYFYPAAGQPRAAVLFLPGDGGWRGFAIDMASALSSAGFDVFGWDVKQYLSGFTSGRTTLSETDIECDVAALARRLGADGDKRRIVLAGWSQGAAMSVLAAAAPANKRLFSGIVAVGLPETGVLGWRLADNLTYVTKREADEPRFATAPRLPAITPLRFGMIHSTADEYITTDAAKRLFSLAAEPKRLDLIPARDHRYSGNREGFLRLLTEHVAWAAQP